jgi:hypothetical protein
MSRSRGARRAEVLAVLVPALAGGLVALSAPAGAVPFEGEPTSGHCLRIVPLPHASPAGSPPWVSHGHVAVLVPRADC